MDQDRSNVSRKGRHIQQSDRRTRSKYTLLRWQWKKLADDRGNIWMGMSIRGSIAKGGPTTTGGSVSVQNDRREQCLCKFVKAVV
jgi:hypothetical protein